jgi:integrase
MMLLAYEGALRVSELIHIRVKDIDFRDGVIALMPSRRRSKERPPLKVGRNVLDAVKAYISEMNLPTEAFLFPGRTKKSCALVSFKCAGGHISKREVQFIFDRFARAAGIKRRGRGIQYLKNARLAAINPGKSRVALS